MENIFTNLLNALTEIWKNIGIAQKVSIILITIVSLGAIAGIVYMGSQPDWQVLYTGLDSKTAAKVYELIKDGGTKIKLQDSGRTIMVPSQDVYRLRLKVAGSGVSVEKTGVGWELFDNMKLGMTDREQQVAFQRAVQGELQQMINEMPGIVSSKVMITMPQKKAFKKDNTRPSASVMIVMDQGRMIAEQQINSIKHLVAGAVNGMTPNDVTITDNQGNLLVRQKDEKESNLLDSNSQLEVCNQTERTLKEKAESILRPIVGYGNAVAVVSCDMDFDNIDKVTENYDPEKVVAISEKIVTEDNSRHSGAGTGGAPGSKSNVNENVELAIKNPTAGATSEEKTTQEQRKTSEKKFVVPKVVEKVTTKGARIKKLTVAVTVSKKKDGTSWSDEEKANFRELVMQAVGVKNYFKPEDIARNKIVTVEEMEFFKEPSAVVKEEGIAFTDKMLFNVERFMKSPLIRPILGVALLAALYMVFKKYFNKSSGGVEGMDLGGTTSTPVEQSAEQIIGEELKKLESEEAKQRIQLGNMIEAVQERTNASPQGVATIMENWLASDQG